MVTLVVDQHLLFAEAVRGALRARGFEDVIVATSSVEALQLLASGIRPDAVLVEDTLSDGPGAAVGAWVRRHCPDAKVIEVVGEDACSSGPATAGAGTDHAGSAAHAVVTKATPLDGLIECVRAVLSGDTIVRLDTRRTPSRRVAPARPTGLRYVDPLTPRELDVLALLVEGCSNEAIARRLAVAPNTVRTHVQNIFTKLGVHSRLEAVTVAVRNSLVAAPERRWTS